MESTPLLRSAGREGCGRAHASRRALHAL